MTFGRALLIGLLVLTVAGCSGGKETQRILDSPLIVDTVVDDDADFSKYETWTWLPLPPGSEIDPAIDNPEFKGNVNNAVERELYTKGYRKNPAAPDLLVNGHAVFEEIDQAYIDEKYDGEYYPDYKTEIDEGGKQKKWKEGTIILFIFDARTRELVYQSSVQAEVTDRKNTTPEQRKQRLDKAIAKMMEKFPKR